MVRTLSINYCLAVKTDEDNQSAVLGGDKLNESGDSSDDTNSQDVEASDRE